MAMAGAVLVSVPCTGAVSGPARQVGSKSEQGNVGTATVNCRAVNSNVADTHGVFSSSFSSPSSSCGGSLQLSCVRRNSRLAWRSSSELFALGGCGCNGSRFNVQAPRKLHRGGPVRISAEKIDPNNVIATLVKLGKQGLDAGTKLVPASVPRPVAQAGVGLAGLVVGSFVLRSLFSTAFCILAVGGLSYIGFLYLTKGEGSSSSGGTLDKGSGKPKSTDEALEEARKIMDKYK
ncbi:hypothetical protein Mapa_015753 [Marchantia paleacea]|nr:hypothetical protein Mapa_015753 [Marchantia paleacea]